MTVLTAYAPLILAGVCGVMLVGAGWLLFRWGYSEGAAAERSAVIEYIKVAPTQTNVSLAFAINYGSHHYAAHRKGDNA